MKSISGKIVNHDSIFNGTIEFSKTIESVLKQDEAKTENIIIPGFVDLHCHGGNGYDTMAGLSSIKKLSQHHLVNGTTTLLPTTLTATLNDTINALEGFNSFIDQNEYTTNILGIPKKICCELDFLSRDLERARLSRDRDRLTAWYSPHPQVT